MDFNGTSIAANGSFSKTSGSSTVVQGQFYNNANALAGIYKGATAQDHVAFGGARN